MKLTQHFETRRGLDFPVFVFDGDPVDSRVFGSDVAYFHGPVVVVLSDFYPAVDADRSTVLFPRRPGRRVTGHAALKPDRLADVRHLVVEDGVEFRRAAPFQSFGTPLVLQFTCDRRRYKQQSIRKKRNNSRRKLTSTETIRTGICIRDKINCLTKRGALKF